MHPACAKIGFLAFFAVATALIHTFWNASLGVALSIEIAAGLLGAYITYSILNHWPGDIWRAEVFVASLWYYTLTGLFIWMVLSWGALTISLGTPTFFLKGSPAALSPHAWARIATTVLYTGLLSPALIWVGLYIAEAFESVFLARLLPILIGLSAALTQQRIVLEVLEAPIWPFLVAGFFYPASLIPWATRSCTAAGLRGAPRIF